MSALFSWPTVTVGMMGSFRWQGGRIPGVVRPELYVLGFASGPWRSPAGGPVRRHRAKGEVAREPSVASWYAIGTANGLWSTRRSAVWIGASVAFQRSR